MSEQTLLDRRCFQIPLMPRRTELWDDLQQGDLRSESYDVVTIKIEPFVRHSNGITQRNVIGFTDQRALACLLIPSFLPGQEVVLEELLAQNDRLADLLMEFI